MLDKMKYTKVSYARSLNKARAAVNDSRFKCLRPMADHVYEVECGYRRIELDVPVYVATNILMEAKMALISYCYDFLMYFVKVEHFNIAFLDTDSLYCGWNQATLEDSVKSERMEEFNHRIYGYCGPARHPLAVLPRKCCASHFQEDQKWPLLWKLEKGDIHTIYSLTSKTYICIDKQQHFKMSCKGANKARVENPAKIFKTVFETREPASTVNLGFQNVRGEMLSYKCQRQAFPWLYIKRQVITSCGAYTQAIPNLVLDPVPITHHCIQTQCPELECDAVRSFPYHNFMFQTVRQAHCYTKYVFCTTHNLPPMERSVKLLARIMRTVNQRELLEIEKTMGECDKFSFEEFDVVYNITCARVNAYPHLYAKICNIEHSYIVNATQMDGRLGTGCSPGICRWEKGAFLRGANIYGKVLMTIQNQLKER